MTAEEYIEQKATICYSGGMNAVKIIAEEYALSAIDLAKKQMVDKACKWIKQHLYDEAYTFRDNEGTWIDIESVISDLKKAMEEYT